MSHRNRFFSPLVIIPILAFSASFAGAQDAGGECASDSDCPSNGICQKAQWTNGCSTPAGAPTTEPGVDPAAPVPPESGSDSGKSAQGDGEDTDPGTAGGDDVECDTTVHEAEFGTCYIPPPQCSSDDDCDEYLSCVQENLGVCWSNSDGTSGCSEPDLDAPSYCQTSYSTECASDSECPREFECVETPVACLAIAIECPSNDPDCGKSACEGEGSKECQPKSIECEADSECPSDWSCLGTVSYECSGSGGAATEGPVDVAIDDSEMNPSEGGREDTAAGSSDAATGGGVSGGEGEGGGSAGGASGTPAAPAEAIDPDGTGEAGREDVPAQQEVCVERATVGFCSPDAWGGRGGLLGSGATVSAEDSTSASKSAPPATPLDPNSSDSDNGAVGEGAPTGADNATDDGSTDGIGFEDQGGGCSVAAGPSAPASSAWFLSLLLLVPGLRRRVRDANKA